MQGHRHKKDGPAEKDTCFVIHNYVEDVKQDEGSVPDLLESIMKAPGLVKQESRPIKKNICL